MTERMTLCINLTHVRLRYALPTLACFVVITRGDSIQYGYCTGMDGYSMDMVSRQKVIAYE
jgi:hypothetical protein